MEDLKEVKKDLQLKMEQIKEQVNNEMEVIEELQLKSG